MQQPPGFDDRRLSERLQEIRTEANGQPLALGRMLELLGDRGTPMLLFVITSPFVLPIPTMGLSGPAGFVGVFVGMCILCGVQPWIPGFIRRRELKPATVDRLVHATCRMFGYFEKIVRPRLQFMVWPGMRSLLGLSMVIGAIILSLPIPIPGTNAVPAIAVLVLCLGLMERDGLLVIVGHLIVAASCVVLWLSWEGTVLAIRKAGEWMGF